MQKFLHVLFFASAVFLIAVIAGAPARAQTTLAVGFNPSSIVFNSVTNKFYVSSTPVTVIDGTTNAVTTLTGTGASSAMAVNSTTNQIYYISGSGGTTLSVIDGATNAVTNIPLGIFNAYAVAVNPVTNKIYIAVANTAGSVCVVDGVTNAVTNLPGGNQPDGIAVNSVTNQIYVVEAGARSMEVIDGATNAITTLGVASGAEFVVVDSTTNEIYVGSAPLTVLNGATNAMTTVAVGPAPQALAINPVTNTIYVAGLVVVGASSLTANGTVTAINGATNAATTINVGIYPSCLAVDTATNTIFVGNEFGNNVSVINGATNAVTATTNAPAPVALAVDPVTNQFYVANGNAVNGNAGSIAVIPGPAGTPVAPPTITTLPQSQSTGAGQSVTFTAAASGSATYQWLFNSTAISGATNASLTLTNVTSASAGTYTVVATNGGGSVSASVTLTVTAVSLPAFTTQPVPQTVVGGTTVVFNSAASGSPTPTFQWKLNGTAISGATSARLVIAGATAAANAGTYTCVATNSQGPTTSSAATLGFVTTTNVGRLVNLSVNTTAGKSQVLTVGFVTGGAGTAGSQTLLLRATGPALAALGVQNVLADPTLTVFSGQTVVTSNDNWGTPASNQATITTADNATGAFALTNPASLDAALVDALAAGGYTVQVSGNTAASGTTLAEVYDYTPANTYTLATPRLINISSNNQIAANGSMTAGFVIGGSTSKTVLIRATGPALAVLGVQGTMPDPQLALHTTINNQDTVLASNAGWGGDPQIATVSAAVGAFPLTSATSKDSVVLVTLSPGDYTAVASSVTGTAGVALIEVYEVP